MCEVKASCKTTGNFWVQTKREILKPESKYVTPGSKSKRNIIACAGHLAKAVRDLNQLNYSAGELHDPSTDGVTVKVRYKTSEGYDLWA